MKYELIRAQYRAKYGPYRVKLWFVGGHWHCSVKRRGKFLGGTLPGQTSSEYRTLTEEYAKRIIEQDVRKMN